MTKKEKIKLYKLAVKYYDTALHYIELCDDPKNKNKLDLYTELRYEWCNKFNGVFDVIHTLDLYDDYQDFLLGHGGYYND